MSSGPRHSLLSCEMAVDNTIDLIARRAPHGDDITSFGANSTSVADRQGRRDAYAVDPTLKNHTIDEDALARLFRDIMQSLDEANSRDHADKRLIPVTEKITVG